MAQINLPNFPEFDVSPRETVATRWDKYVKKLNRLFTAMNIDVDIRKQAMLLHYAGDDVQDIFETLTLQAPYNFA